jgi:hypothetical protein
MWKLWCLALGEKASKKNHEADYVAIVRSTIFLTYLVTNIFIIYGVTRTHIFPVSQQPVKCIIINK